LLSPLITHPAAPSTLPPAAVSTDPITSRRQHRPNHIRFSPPPPFYHRYRPILPSFQPPLNQFGSQTPPSRRWIALGYHSSSTSPHLPSPPAIEPPRFGDCIDPTYNTLDNSLFRFAPKPAPVDCFTPTFYPQPVASDNSSSAALILDPDFPCSEPFPPLRPTPFGHSFGVPYTDSFGTNHARRVTIKESFASYSFPPPVLRHLDAATPLPVLCHQLQTLYPFILAAALASQNFADLLFPLFDRRPPDSSSLSHCLAYSARPIPSISDWKAAYDGYPDTLAIIKHLSSSPHEEWDSKDLNSVHSSYRELLHSGAISILNGRLTLGQTISTDSRALLLIIVHGQALREKQSK
jgi:hypothetical protein